MPSLFSVEDDQRIIHLAPGLKHGMFGDDRRFLLLSLAQLQGYVEASAFENRKRDRRSDDELTRCPLREIRQLKTLESRTAIKRNARIKVRLRHADRCCCRVQLSLGLPDVGPALYEF